MRSKLHNTPLAPFARRALSENYVTLAVVFASHIVACAGLKFFWVFPDTGEQQREDQLKMTRGGTGGLCQSGDGFDSPHLGGNIGFRPRRAEYT